MDLFNSGLSTRTWVYIAFEHITFEHIIFRQIKLWGVFRIIQWLNGLLIQITGLAQSRSQGSRTEFRSLNVLDNPFKIRMILARSSSHA